MFKDAFTVHLICNIESFKISGFLLLFLEVTVLERNLFLDLPIMIYIDKINWDSNINSKVYMSLFNQFSLWQLKYKKATY